MSGIAMSAPSRASASTMPRPIPLPPPVTTATLPASRMETPSIYNRCPGGTHDSTPAQKPQLVRAQRPRWLRPSLVAQSRRIQLTLSSTGVRSSASPTRGPTNAIIHLVAIAGRVGVPLPLERFDDLSKTTPFLVNRRPSGKYLMEDFFERAACRRCSRMSGTSYGTVVLHVAPE